MFVTGDIRNRSGSLSSGVSHTSSEADVSKDSDLSKDLDNSDIEDATASTRPLKKCVQRLFSPELRHTDHVTDPTSSPESLPERLHNIDSDRLPPLAEVIHNPSVVVKPQPVNALTGEQHVVIQKPKIWSISEIIGGAAKTVAAGSLPNCQPDNHVSGQSTYPFSSEQYSYANYTTDYTQCGSYQKCFYPSSYAGDLLQPEHFQTSDTDPVLYL